MSVCMYVYMYTYNIYIYYDAIKTITNRGRVNDIRKVVEKKKDGEIL